MWEIFQIHVAICIFNGPKLSLSIPKIRGTVDDRDEEEEEHRKGPINSAIPGPKYDSR